MNDETGRAAAPLRVLALVSDAPGTGGGIAAYNAELLAALATRPGGCEVTLLARRRARDGVDAPGTTASRAPTPLARFVARALQLGVSRSFHWLFCGHLNLVPLARVVAAMTGARLWLQVHGIEAWQAPGASTRAAVERAHLVTAVSRFTRQRLLSWAHVHPARVHVLNNTYGAGFGPGEPDHALLERVAPGGQPVILTVSRLDSRERYKGHAQVLQALATPRLSGTRAPVYVVAGEGDDRPRLKALAERLGIGERVHFLGGVAEARLPSLYRSARVFAMPSQGEGFGIVFLEAAACGVPVIAGDADGARDALRDGLLGTLVDATDPEAIAGAIEHALHDPQRPQGFQVFARDGFRRQLLALLDACPGPVAGERWL